MPASHAHRQHPSTGFTISDSDTTTRPRICNTIKPHVRHACNWARLELSGSPRSWEAALLRLASVGTSSYGDPSGARDRYSQPGSPWHISNQEKLSPPSSKKERSSSEAVLGSRELSNAHICGLQRSSSNTSRRHCSTQSGFASPPWYAWRRSGIGCRKALA